MGRLRKVEKQVKNRFTHHFETPYWYQNVWNWILFHFRMKWVNLRNDPPTQNSKNPKIMVLAPFWNPILVPNCAELNSLSFPNEMSQPTQLSAYAKFKTSENQGFGTILKPHIGIKLCRIEFSFTSKRNESAHAMTHLRKTKKKRKSRFWHLFETPLQLNWKIRTKWHQLLKFQVYLITRNSASPTQKNYLY